MKLHAFIIEPLSAFGTPLKADTLFGHFCWQAAHDPELLNEPLDALIDHYDQRPFVIFASAMPCLPSVDTPYAVPRPQLPIRQLFPAKGSRMETILAAKERKQCKWLLVDRDLCLRPDENRLISDGQLARMTRTKSQAGDDTPSWSSALLGTHNTINRRTGTTGSGPFAPYQAACTMFAPGTQLAIFTAIDETATSADQVFKALVRIGTTGFGRDASTGLGRFRVVEHRLVSLPRFDSTTVLFTMGPAVLHPGRFTKISFKPFVRFGRHGDHLACGPHPFKNPVVMADEGAVCLPPAAFSDFPGYTGCAVRGVSKAMPRAVTQGYTICLPLVLPD